MVARSPPGRADGRLDLRVDSVLIDRTGGSIGADSAGICLRRAADSGSSSSARLAKSQLGRSLSSAGRPLRRLARSDGGAEREGERKRAPALTPSPASAPASARAPAPASALAPTPAPAPAPSSKSWGGPRLAGAAEPTRASVQDFGPHGQRRSKWPTRVEGRNGGED